MYSCNIHCTYLNYNLLLLSLCSLHCSKTKYSHNCLNVTCWKQIRKSSWIRCRKHCQETREYKTALPKIKEKNNLLWGEERENMMKCWIKKKMVKTKNEQYNDKYYGNNIFLYLNTLLFIDIYCESTKYRDILFHFRLIACRHYTYIQELQELVWREYIYYSDKT